MAKPSAGAQTELAFKSGLHFDAPAVAEVLSEASRQFNKPAIKLVARLRAIGAMGLHRSVCAGDTAVSRTLETLLGIEINSRRTPDYMGIEIKAGRVRTDSAKVNRATLFAQVPNWEISSAKSSRELLRRHGYWRSAGDEREFKLYVTVNGVSTNSRGLFLRFSDGQSLVEERHRGADGVECPVAVWRMSALHDRLLEKHAETMWVEVETHTLDGAEHFAFRTATHTRAPSIAMFDSHLHTGSISVDHLIKGHGESGLERVQEKGPLWKAERSALQSLFSGEAEVHALC